MGFPNPGGFAMARQLTILVGTMTGTADLVAEELRDRLGGPDLAIEIRPMDRLDIDVFERGGPVLVCTSTYGQGDVPDNGQAFFQALQDKRPDLSGIAYGVIALGDRTYGDTYCQGGRRFDALLAELGARRVGEPMLHDASAGTMPEELAVEWAENWIEAAFADRLAA
jgi:MioC protein